MNREIFCRLNTGFCYCICYFDFLFTVKFVTFVVKFIAFAIDFAALTIEYALAGELGAIALEFITNSVTANSLIYRQR